MHLLAFASGLNAFYTFWRKRHYRLFENSIDTAPSTPSAQRVQVSSSPMVSSPLKFLSNVIAVGSAEARAHPSAERDVWEVAVWDPHPLAIRLFCLFSPGHVLIYWLFLPTVTSDSRPSVTIATTIFLAALLTAQMSTLSASYSRQSKDSSLIHKEVFNEYDKKFVHPRTQSVTRSVGTQYSENMASQAQFDAKYNVVEASTPGVTRQDFKISPNPNYFKHIDPEGSLKRNRLASRPSLSSPSKPSVVAHLSGTQTPTNTSEPSTPLRQLNTALRQPQFRPTPTGDGGSLGVFSHANSPLRKSVSSHFDQRSGYRRDDMGGSPVKRPSSPLKRSSVPGGGSSETTTPRSSHLANVGHSVRRETGRF